MLGSKYNTYGSSTIPIEICMVGLGNHGTRPTLFIRTETEIFIYRVGYFVEETIFKKLNLIIF